MASYVDSALKAFWDEDFWLPPNVTWKDVAPGANPDVRHCDHRDLLYVLPMMLVILLLRYLFEKYCFTPAGIFLGIKNARPKKSLANPILEKAYSLSKHMDHKQVQGLAKQLDWPERQVERWWRLRKGQDKPSLLTRFCETSWRCLYYSFIFIYGMVILWDKSWLWDIDQCWKGLPHHSITRDVWWYYMITLSFYFSLCVSQFFDVKRKDFWEMFLHHIAAISLLYISWICNLTRLGNLVLVVHDCSDVFLEAAKLAKYSRYQKTGDVIFAIFTIVWIFTRLGIFPFWIIYNSMIVAPKRYPMFLPYNIINAFFCVLFLLHIFWTYLILKIVKNSLKSGHVEGDIRSSSNSNYSEESVSQ